LSDLPTTGDTDFYYDYRLPEKYEIVEWVIGMAIRLLPIFLTLYVITAFKPRSIPVGVEKTNYSGE